MPPYMFLFDCFIPILDCLTTILRELLAILYVHLFGREDSKIVVIGLDDAGKTTLIRAVKSDMIAQQMPVAQSTPTAVCFGGVRLDLYDLSGYAQARHCWEDSYHDVSAIVFVVDAHDRTRFAEAKAELDDIQAKLKVAKCPILVLGNKIDLPGAASYDELCKGLGLHTLRTTGSRRPIQLFMCSALCGPWHQGFRWLAQNIHV